MDIHGQQKQNQSPVLADGCATGTIHRQMKYIVKEQNESGHRIFSVIKDLLAKNTLTMPHYYDAVIAKQPEKLKEYIKKLIKEY